MQIFPAIINGMKTKKITNRIIPCVFLFLLFVSCSRQRNSDIIKGDYSIKTISDSTDVPAIDLTKGNYKKIVLLLHHEKSPEKIKKFLGITDSRYDVLINGLFGEGLIKRSNDGKFFPSFMIIDKDEAGDLEEIAKPIGDLIAEIIKDRINLIKKEYAGIATFRNIKFDTLSLFILSDVLLNKWQVENIEAKFLKSQRPARGGKHYYLSMQQIDSTSEDEPFDVYYDNTAMFKTYAVGNYSSKRPDIDSLYNRYKDLEKYFEQLKPYALKLGENIIPVFEKDNSDKLYNISSVISEDLVALLEKNRRSLMNHYLGSIYKDQISFREYFVWVYQFIAKEATNKLIKDKLIHVPENLSQSYILLTN